MKQVRQGDVLLEKVNIDVNKLHPISENIPGYGAVLAHGEVTGHHHTVANADLFQNDEGKKFVRVNSKSTVKHQEHDPIDIEEGVWEVILPRQYNLAGEISKVAD